MRAFYRVTVAPAAGAEGAAVLVASGVAASTLAAAAMFSPLRRWLLRLVDSRFNRGHYDCEELVAAFAARLRDPVDLETVRRRLLATADQAAEPAHVSLWLRDDRPS